MVAVRGRVLRTLTLAWPQCSQGGDERAQPVVWAFTAKGMPSGGQWERESRSKVTCDFFPKTKIEERGKIHLKLTLQTTQSRRKGGKRIWLVFQYFNFLP